MPPAPAPRILLADCDHMFVSVARLLDPEGAGKARFLVVGGSSRRGVVVSASYEARVFGVRAGMPSARAARLCPGLTFAPVSRKDIGAKHHEVRAVLEEWSPVVEAASVDEFYLDLSGTEQVYHSEPLAETARKMRAEVLRRTGLPLSFGGGTNRPVAKLAAERAKPRPGSAGTGVLIIPPGGESGFLADHSLAEIPGVGPRLQATLKRYGLTTVPDALRVDAATFENWLGPRSGRWLFERIRGQGSGFVDSDPAARSLSHQETFPRDLVSDDALETHLLRLVTSLSGSLRAEGLATGCITVKLRDHDFRTRSASRSVPEPIRTDRALYAVAHELLRVLRSRRRVAARLLGVAFSSLEGGDGPPQLMLFPRATPSRESPRDRRLAKAVDQINEKLGGRAIRPARLVRSDGRRSP